MTNNICSTLPPESARNPVFVKSSAMYSRLIVWLLLYFDLWGFCTEYPPSSYRKHLSYIIIFIIHNGFILFALLFSIYENLVDDTLSTQFHLANDAFKTYSAILTYWIVIMESIYCRAAQRQFWRIIREIRRSNGKKYPIKLATFTFFYIQSVLLTIIGDLLFIYTHPNMLERKTYLIIFDILNHMCMNRIHYYTLHVETVRTHLEHTIRLIRNQYVNTLSTGTCSRAFRQSFELLAESMECINRIFGWSNAATILFSFHLLLAISNWTIALVSGSPSLTIFGKVIKVSRSKLTVIKQ